MQRFKTAQARTQQQYFHSFLLRGDNTKRNPERFSDLGDLKHSAPVFQHEDAVDLSSSSVFSIKSSNVAVGGSNLQYGTLNTSLGSAEIASSGAACLDAEEHLMYEKGGIATSSMPSGNRGHVENWADSGMADNSQQTDDTSTDIDADDRNQCNRVHQHGALLFVGSKHQTKVKAEDHKSVRRLAQNREAARKSRLRKKAYVQQLENSRLRLEQLEQELQRARQQGVVIASPGDQGHSAVGNAFDMDYAHWVDEHQRLLNDLRSSVNSETGDDELHLLVDGVMAHYDELFRLKSAGAKADVLHVLSGTWMTPAERWLMWLGGFRPSELLKIVRNHLEPLTEQQLMGIYNLQLSSQQAEDALSQGLDALHQSLRDTLSPTSLGPTGVGNDVADYMGQMGLAMGSLATLESFLHQADLLKQETLQQLQRILTTRQIARALLVINDYISRLRALSSLWLARPRE